MRIGMVRIAHRDGMRTAECIERSGDWAITRNDVGRFVLTHLPTGFCLTSTHHIEFVEQRALLVRLAALPKYDLQTMDLAAIQKVLKP
jgi:hypothetical protein